MGENRVESAQKTTWQERLSWFAASHIMISLFGFVAGPICLGLGEVLPLYVAFYIGTVVLLFLYVVAGFHAAREHGWNAPVGAKDGFLAFLRPALIAWAWGGILLTTAYFRQTSGLASLMLIISAIGASPSFLIVILSAMSGLFDNGPLGVLIGLFLAGGIPPLLFLLGSLWGSRRYRKQTKKGKGAAHGSCVSFDGGGGDFGSQPDADCDGAAPPAPEAGI